MRNLDKFSERLTELMSNDMTTDELGAILGVDGSSVRLWKSGNSVFLSNAIKIADCFHCSIDFLVGRSETILDFVPKTCLPFYDCLRQVMNEKLITSYRLFQDLQISSSNLTNWKKGADPFLQTVVLICDYLDVSIDYLVGRDR